MAGHEGVPVCFICWCNWLEVFFSSWAALQDSFNRHTSFCHDFLLDGYWLQNTLFLSNKVHPVNAGALLYYLCRCFPWYIPSGKAIHNGTTTTIKKNKTKPTQTNKNNNKKPLLANLSLVFYFWDICDLPCWPTEPQGRF